MFNIINVSFSSWSPCAKVDTMNLQSGRISKFSSRTYRSLHFIRGRPFLRTCGRFARWLFTCDSKKNWSRDVEKGVMSYCSWFQSKTGHLGEQVPFGKYLWWAQAFPLSHVLFFLNFGERICLFAICLGSETNTVLRSRDMWQAQRMAAKETVTEGLITWPEFQAGFPGWDFSSASRTNLLRKTFAITWRKFHYSPSWNFQPGFNWKSQPGQTG